MKNLKKFARLNRTSSHRRAMLRCVLGRAGRAWPSPHVRDAAALARGATLAPESRLGQHPGPVDDRSWCCASLACGRRHGSPLNALCAAACSPLCVMHAAGPPRRPLPPPMPCRNMVTSLIKHERIKTTLPKAKALRRVADKMVTHAKIGECCRARPTPARPGNAGASNLFVDVGAPHRRRTALTQHRVRRIRARPPVRLTPPSVPFHSVPRTQLRGPPGNLHHRRLAASYVMDRETVAKLFDTLGPRYE